MSYFKKVLERAEGLGMSIHELARSAGCSWREMFDIYHGTSEPTQYQIERLKGAFGPVVEEAHLKDEIRRCADKANFYNMLCDELQEKIEKHIEKHGSKVGDLK